MCLNNCQSGNYNLLNNMINNNYIKSARLIKKSSKNAKTLLSNLRLKGASRDTLMLTLGLWLVLGPSTKSPSTSTYAELFYMRKNI